MTRIFLVMLNNQMQLMALKLLQKRAIEKTAETTSNLIGNIIADKTMKVSKNAQQSNLEAVANDHDKEIPKERYTFPEERQKIIYDLRLI